MRSDYAYFADEIRREIEDHLSGVGLLFRVFARGKDPKSLQNKMEKEPGKYSIGGKLIQDAVGVRVALYFQDDISVVKSILETKFKLNHESSTIDTPEADQFSITRYNLVFEFPSETSENFRRVANGQPIDSTFEVQLRSILSEGWHEVEHDLRYKAKEDWNGHDDLSRTLNGIVATLETSEWTMSKLFEELAYRHYKNKNWNGMLPSLLRMRLRGHISDNIINALNSDSQAAKDLLRIDRAHLIKILSKVKPKIPINSDNMILLWNLIGPKHICLENITPDLLREAAINAQV
jgi:ppGpp synthetase/RelA/SpoT-type nucleotidyltranferase